MGLTSCMRNRRRSGRQLWVAALIALSFGMTLSVGDRAYALNCQQVKTLLSVYFKMHFSQRDFDDELSRRTLDNFIKTWDPGKVYFLKADVDEFKKKYATKLDDLILQNKCKVIEQVVNRYSKRFQERLVEVKKQIAAKHDFTIDEYMIIDRKKLEWATTTEEVSDRWRRRVKFQLLQLKKTLGSVKKAQDKLKKRYDLQAKRHNELTSDDVYAAFLNAFSSSLDPHSEYYDPEQLEDFRINTRLSLEGIGAVLRTDDGFTVIQSLVPGGAASKTERVKAGDKIIMVGQGAEPPVDVIDMDLREVVKLIRGTRGTEVRLTVVREDAGKTSQLVVPIIREKIQLKDKAAKSYVHKVQLKGRPSGPKPEEVKIGVIDLPSFYMDFEGRQNRERNFKSSSADMKREIEKLKKDGVAAIVVDLRSNGGGSLDESINIAGLFFDKGPVVQIKDPRGATYVQKDEDGKTFYDGPLVVMINRQSASASEIFAGAIQDYGRGLIVGDTHTFGKGTVQNLNDIDEKLGAIKVTISKFYRPSGSSTQLRGVESDIVLPSILDEYEMGEKFYDYALPWEKIKTSEYKRMRHVGPHLRKVAERSKSRVAADKNFDEIREAISEFKKSAEERSRVSLKEEKEGAKDKEKDKIAKDTKRNAKEDENAKAVAEALEDDEDEVHNLSKDPQLQETLRIATDFARLLAKKPVGDMVLPEVLDVSVAANKKSDKKSADKHP